MEAVGRAQVGAVGMGVRRARGRAAMVLADLVAGVVQAGAKGVAGAKAEGATATRGRWVLGSASSPS
ncbi:hypothetical protein KRR26_18760 [Corallococcus sp. M34]|uniref:hypothetical protein n=1 Tax=Citreicoccus inhibens TaxID=2849499 RepID=UPI001C21E236|nr:hypothetical protein [Citreicoccus inhibens]MBU8897662.1 hypothetical protein [Citreicoccus inhibens]